MSQIKAKKFRGSSAQQFENIFECFTAHKGHSLKFDLVDLDQAAIQCSKCDAEVISGSRELIEFIWMTYSANQTP